MLTNQINLFACLNPAPIYQVIVLFTQLNVYVTLILLPSFDIEIRSLQRQIPFVRTNKNFNKNQIVTK